MFFDQTQAPTETVEHSKFVNEISSWEGNAIINSMNLHNFPKMLGLAQSIISTRWWRLSYYCKAQINPIKLSGYQINNAI